MDGRDTGFTTSHVPPGDSAAGLATAKYLFEVQTSASNELVDHQLVAYIPATKDRPLQIEIGFVVYNISAVYTANLPASVDNNARNATPATYGMSATDVSANNSIDDTSSSLLYSPGWSHSTGSFWDALCWNETSSKTNQVGAWVETTFAGTGIWQVGDYCTF